MRFEAVLEPRKGRHSPHLPPDALWQIFSYCGTSSLAAARVACRIWRELADKAPAWRSLCAELWLDKQNHPVEQWVRLPVPLPDPEDAVRDQIELLLLLKLFAGGTLRTSSARAMDMLNLIRIINVDRKAAPISHVLREEQIELENHLWRKRIVLYLPSSPECLVLRVPEARETSGREHRESASCHGERPRAVSQ